jgi:hypothetical protein
MPPRRRGPARAPADPTAPPYPLYGPTHTLYRVSPLHNGTAPLTASLPIHARRLRDAIAGDALRGVPLSSADSNAQDAENGAGAWGAFRGCTMRLLGTEAAWERAHARGDDDSDSDEISGAGDDVQPAEAVGVVIELAFERATHAAVLLGDAAGKARVPGFTCLPLLLVRMPAALRGALLRFLGTAFDARVAPMRLRRRFLGRALDTVIDKRLAEGQRGGALVDVGAFPRGLQLQLAFPAAAPMLKNIDVDLNQADLSEFVSHGQKLWEQRATNDQASESPITGPFTMALAEYLSRHLALNFEHSAVVLSKFSLGPFALSGEGKVKVMESSPEAQDIWKLLLEESAATRLKSTLPISTSGGKGLPQKAAVNPSTPSPTRQNGFNPGMVDELT